MIKRSDPDPTVLLHYVLRLDDGVVLDHTEETTPLRFRLGDGTLHPALERCLAGLEAGARETFRIGPEEGFGPYDPDMIQELGVDEFSDPAMLVPGTVIEFETPAGDAVAGRVLSVDGERARVDFNHPLAGREFEFEVHLLTRE